MYKTDPRIFKNNKLWHFRSISYMAAKEYSRPIQAIPSYILLYDYKPIIMYCENYCDRHIP